MIKQLLNSAIAKYRDLSVARRSIICLCLRHRQIIDLLATDKSRYFAQSRPIIVYYFTLSLQEQFVPENYLITFPRLAFLHAKLQIQNEPNFFATVSHFLELGNEINSWKIPQIHRDNPCARFPSRWFESNREIEGFSRIKTIPILPW